MGSWVGGKAAVVYFEVDMDVSRNRGCFPQNGW